MGFLGSASSSTLATQASEPVSEPTPTSVPLPKPRKLLKRTPSARSTTSKESSTPAPPRPAVRPGSIMAGPSSPSASVGTRASDLNWGGLYSAPRVVVTRQDLRNSLEAYEDLLKSAKAFRNAMRQLATASAAFASALETCARQKGARCQREAKEPSRHPSASVAQALGLHVAPQSSNASSRTGGRTPPDLTLQPDELEDERAASDRLYAASGLHHLMSNHDQVLSDNFYKNFEIPLLESFDAYRVEVVDRQASYEKALADKSKRIRETEAENMKAGRKRQRDLAQFRRALQELQSQVDDLDRLKAEHYTEVLEAEQTVWSFVANRVALVVKTEVDTFDKFASKGTSDTVLASMCDTHPDPFESYAQNEPAIFSILHPLNSQMALPRLNSSTISTPQRQASNTSGEWSVPTSPNGSTPRRPSMRVTAKSQSTTGISQDAETPTKMVASTTEAASMLSAIDERESRPSSPEQRRFSSSQYSIDRFETPLPEDSTDSRTEEEQERSGEEVQAI